ncbi:MAG: PadR family transcriptional regulator [Oscillospiraceae bacterium]|jgi:PadR family transcriptional regulator PadR|nr:PadR family transcriptional regulator [Oscillospiraceae bacterium]
MAYIPLGGALLELLVLGELGSGAKYGYELTHHIRDWFDIAESGIYPVLRRLQTEGALDTYDEAHDGRNRRYYKLTPAGAEKLAKSKRGWHCFKTCIDQFLAETEGTEP